MLFILPTLAFASDASQIVVTGAWIRELLPGQDMTAAYFVIENRGPEADHVTSVSCECASSAEIHNMVTTDGKMKMQAAGKLEIPARGGKVELKPGGLHVMLFGVKAPLKEGMKTNLLVRFEHFGELKVEAVVKASEGKK